MTIEHHSLTEEFGEFKDLIHELKMNDNHFKRLFNEYDTIDREVIRYEQEIDAACDERLEDAKKKRLLIKDELYQMLTKARADV